MIEPAIHTVALAKRYGKVTALRGLDMTIPRGSVFGFLGPNGAGKTTAIKLLLGLTKPTGGRAEILGRPVGGAASRRTVGYLPELFRYQPWLTAREVLAVHCGLTAVPRPSWTREIDQALETVGLAKRDRDKVGTFSKGMQQRLGIGVALTGSPALVFLDEPTSALDPVGRYDVREIIRDLRSKGVTVFLNSHLLTEVEQVCDRVTIVNKGATVADGTLDELLGGGEVRLHLTGPDASAALAGFGTVRREGDWTVVRGIDPGRIPDLVAGAVAAGARVHAVEPRRDSLEERFLGLLREDA